MPVHWPVPKERGKPLSLPPAAEQWLRDFAKGKRQPIRTEGSKDFPQRK